MTLLIAEARTKLPDAVSVVRDVCEHFLEHDARIAVEGDTHTVTFDFGVGTLQVQSDALTLRAAAKDINELYFLRLVLAGHIKEFAGLAEPEIIWSGAGSDLVTPPNFRLARVIAVRDVTPHMRRVTFSGGDLARYAGDDNIHVGLVIPPEGHDPVWPTVGKDGLIQWHAGPGRPTMRRYTIRRYDATAGTLDIDFVVHEDAGPGSAFALRAKPGDMVGLLGPGGGGMPPRADWYLLVGDETALPAIARIIETLPPQARGIALIEVSDDAEEQRIEAKAGIDIRWLHRNGAETGATALLADAVRETAFPDDGASVFAWIACELDGFKAIRAHLRKERGLKKTEHFAVAYWRKGKTDDDKFDRDDG